MHDRVDHALGYFRLGWAILPLSGKRPYASRTGAVQDWIDRHPYAYLPEAARRSVVEFLRESGEHWPTSERALDQALLKGGYLVVGKDQRPQHAVRIGEKTRCVLQIPLLYLDGDEGDEDVVAVVTSAHCDAVTANPEAGSDVSPPVTTVTTLTREDREEDVEAGKAEDPTIQGTLSRPPDPGNGGNGGLERGAQVRDHKGRPQPAGDGAARIGWAAVAENAVTADPTSSLARLIARQSGRDNTGGGPPAGGRVGVSSTSATSRPSRSRS